MKQLLIYISVIFSLSIQCLAQDKALADEYYQNSEYHKAVVYYEKVVDDKGTFGAVYPKYLQSLFYIQDFEKAQELCKTAIKTSKLNQRYKVDYGMVLEKQGLTDKSKSYFEKIIKDLPESAFYVKQAADGFVKYGKYRLAEKAYLTSREKRKAKSLHFFQLSNLYTTQNDKKKLTDHLLYGVDNTVVSTSYVQNTLQRVYDKKDYNGLEIKLLGRLQNDPDNYFSVELLIWLYYQVKDFNSALVQAKSYDLKQKNNGKKSFQVASISMKNKDYKTASAGYQFVIDNFKGAVYYLRSRKMIVQAKEEVVVESFPIDTAKVRSLIFDYQKILDEFGKIHTNAPVLKRIAVLYAFYLQDTDKALENLNLLEKVQHVDKKLLAEAKLTKGDIFILKEEPWEAILIFGQVEKENKFSKIAHEAKYKASELSYFIGEFELAKSHLDILKRSTTKEIANNAIDLSVFITDNSGLDTSFDALYDYAQIELMVFQNRHMDAIAALDTMLKKYPDHSLTDEIYYQKALIYREVGKFELAVKELDKVIKNYHEDVLADDAMFLAGNILEENLKNNERAKAYYKDILLKQAGSIYVSEAREKFRTLRGDFN